MVHLLQRRMTHFVLSMHLATASISELMNNASWQNKANQLLCHPLLFWCRFSHSLLNFKCISDQTSKMATTQNRWGRKSLSMKVFTAVQFVFVLVHAFVLISRHWVLLGDNDIGLWSYATGTISGERHFNTLVKFTSTKILWYIMHLVAFYSLDVHFIAAEHTSVEYIRKLLVSSLLFVNTKPSRPNSWETGWKLAISLVSNQFSTS